MTEVTVAGLLLAAGAGTRMGQPKALLVGGDGVPFLDRAVGVLFDGGCDTVTVVLGAAADPARAILAAAGWTDDPAVSVLFATGWADGMGASLRTGLAALYDGPATAAVVTLVDLPDVTGEVVARLLALAGAGPEALGRATYDGRPGHPVVLGRTHWADAADSASGDRGARDYLDAHLVVEVPCGDLATGRDVDRPEERPGGLA